MATAIAASVAPTTRDEAADAALRRHRREEQDRLKDLAIDGDECEREKEPARVFGKCIVELFADIALPLARLRLAVHPNADEQQDRRGEQRAKPFGEFAARAADGDQARRDPPGQDSRTKRADPADMYRSRQLGPLGLVEERQHGDHDEQRFEALAEQNRERAEEC